MVPPVHVASWGETVVKIYHWPIMVGNYSVFSFIFPFLVLLSLICINFSDDGLGAMEPEFLLLL